MNPIDFSNPVGIWLALLTLVWIAGSLWYLYACTGYVGDLCQACREEMRREREATPIVVQATPDMTPAQLADLLREAEATLQAERASLAQS